MGHAVIEGVVGGVEMDIGQGLQTMDVGGIGGVFFSQLGNLGGRQQRAGYPLIVLSCSDRCR